MTIRGKVIGIDPGQVVRAALFAIDAPDDVDINEILVRPIAQPMQADV